MEQERLQDLQRATDELGVGRRRHPAHGDLERSRGEDASAQRAVRGYADHRVERLTRSPDPRAELGHGERARAGFPEQDLHARGGGAVLRKRELIARADERRACERVEQRPLDDAIARHVDDVVANGLVRRGDREQACEACIATRGVGRAPDEDDLAEGCPEEAAEIGHAVLGSRQRRQRPIDDVGGGGDVCGNRHGLVVSARVDKAQRASELMEVNCDAENQISHS